MHYLTDTETLLAEGVLSQGQVSIIKDRSRAAMVALGVNTVLTTGIIAAAGGFIFWLGETFAVAMTGSLFLVLGALVLLYAGPLYRMLGNAAALIGAGMLTGGATMELIDKAETSTAASVLLVAGGLACVATLVLRARMPKALGFVLGSLALMTGVMHLVGLYYGLSILEHSTWTAPLSHFYATLFILGLGYLLDVRVVTAFAIVPFAQMLDTSTAYFGAAYAFFSPEPTLSILQMSLALVLGLWLLQHHAARIGRHGGIFAMMAFIVGNLCFLVGSLWGDVVGSSLYYQSHDHAEMDWEAVNALSEEFAAKTLNISADVYSILWAVVLVAMLAYAAHRNRRGLFNAALTFGAIHAYTQFFESFGEEPLAYVIGGLAAIPLAWGLWRMNEWFRGQHVAPLEPTV